MEKIIIKEVIVVEGRDDTTAVKKAVDGITIETHGFGIKKETWKLIDKAYENQGLIIFTDPDFSGEEIRKRLTDKYPESKQAFLPREEATKNGDIGIENAKPEDIISALQKVKCMSAQKENTFSMDDLLKWNLSGQADSAKRRIELGKSLGIGYGNSKAFLNKLNGFNISREIFEEKVRLL